MKVFVGTAFNEAFTQPSLLSLVSLFDFRGERSSSTGNDEAQDLRSRIIRAARFTETLLLLVKHILGELLFT